MIRNITVALLKVLLMHVETIKSILGTAPHHTALQFTALHSTVPLSIEYAIILQDCKHTAGVVLCILPQSGWVRL